MISLKSVIVVSLVLPCLGAASWDGEVIRRRPVHSEPVQALLDSPDVSNYFKRIVRDVERDYNAAISQEPQVVQEEEAEAEAEAEEDEIPASHEATPASPRERTFQQFFIAHEPEFCRGGDFTVAEILLSDGMIIALLVTAALYGVYGLLHYN